LNIGSVIRTFVPDTQPPKVKFFIIVGDVDGILATVFINHELRIQTLPSELQGLQLPITPRECPFLSYDSLIDCSDVRERNKSKINNVLQRDPGRLVGRIPEDIMESVKCYIKRAKSIDYQLKKKYGLTF
jgi:hypothetical protein